MSEEQKTVEEVTDDLIPKPPSKLAPGIAIFDSMSDFVKVHIEPHPANQTIITYQDGTKDVFGEKKDEE